MDLIIENQIGISRIARSAAIEDYLKAIYVLGQDYGRVSTSLLAAYLCFAPPSVTGMLQKLAKLELVIYTPYQGVTLTERGQYMALEVLRHHRLLELFLVQELGYSWEEVHAEAEVLEHVISERLEARIAAHLGHPTADPHGDPIPHIDGTLPLCPCQPLADLPLGATGQITRVTDQHPDRLRYLAEVGLVPGAVVTLRAREPFDGPITFDVGNTIHHLDVRLARAILVQDVAAIQDSLEAQKEV
jgi:DtxR family transcriptional regulator, Mn-dependent transcriptional regulator